MSPPRNPATALATAVIDELVRGGVTDLVLAPGSRSAPLAFAAHAADQAGRLRLHTRIDERSAGFLALGLARTSRRPVPVVTTSGTAVTNLHPAVAEAHHAAVRLLVISADRPADLRGTGANQTTDQVKLFGTAVRQAVDVPAPHAGSAGEQAAQLAGWRSLTARLLLGCDGRAGDPPGPVHLNLQLEAPLTPDADGGWTTPADGRPDGRPWTTAPASGRCHHAAQPVPAGQRTVVVAGDDAGPRARLLAQAGRWPLLAEPTSGARTGPNAIRAYRLLLADPDLAGRVQRVVVCGHPTLSRPVSALLSRPGVEVLAVTGDAGWTDPGHRVSQVLTAAEAEPDDPAWLAEWQQRDEKLTGEVWRLLDASDELTGPHLAHEVAATLPPYGLLFCGSSQPVRDLDLVAPAHPVGEHRMVVGNRGLAGIDGTVSAAVGAALGRPHSTSAVALVGDLTFCHDANGLLLGPDEPRPDLRIVVANDDGGSVFAPLEQGAPAHADDYERLFGTPHGADLGALCAASGTPHRRVSDRAALREALSAPAHGIDVVEAVLRRDNRRDLDAALHSLL